MFQPVKRDPILAVLMVVAASSLIHMTTILAKMLGQGGLYGETLHPLQVSAGSMLKDPKATQE